MKTYNDVNITENDSLSQCCPILSLILNNINTGTITTNNNSTGCNGLIELLSSCPDQDDDGIIDSNDNCISDFNPGQEDFDNDNVGNGCDNCPEVSNPLQSDTDLNGIGDLCQSDTIINHGIVLDTADIFLKHNFSGIILKSNDGSCYKIVVSNTGDLESYKVECPDD